MPPGILLDVTRLASRLNGRPLSGIDRVELAWAKHLQTLEIPVFGLMKLGSRQYLLDRQGVGRLARSFANGSAEQNGQVSLMMPARLRPRARAWMVTRKAVIGSTSRKDDLQGLIRRNLPQGSVYMNLGHSNLTENGLGCVGAVLTSFVMVHDAIPLDFPEYQSPESIGQFAKKLEVVESIGATLVHSTRSAQKDVARHLRSPEPTGIVAPFGASGDQIESDEPAPGRHFVALSTIEPRKNHDHLFKIWESMIADPPVGGVPVLNVIGRRGWARADTFDRLEKLKLSGYVNEFNELSDTEVTQQLRSSRGLLFPSLAEGFGFPVLEAAKLGIPCLCSDLPVFREVSGDIPVYLCTNDLYAWRETIIQMMDDKKQRAERSRILNMVQEHGLPTWEDHFKTVLTSMG